MDWEEKTIINRHETDLPEGFNLLKCPFVEQEKALPRARNWIRERIKLLIKPKTTVSIERIDMQPTKPIFQSDFFTNPREEYDVFADLLDDIKQREEISPLAKEKKSTEKIMTELFQFIKAHPLGTKTQRTLAFLVQVPGEAEKKHMLEKTNQNFLQDIFKTLLPIWKNNPLWLNTNLPANAFKLEKLEKLSPKVLLTLLQGLSLNHKFKDLSLYDLKQNPHSVTKADLIAEIKKYYLPRYSPELIRKNFLKIKKYTDQEIRSYATQMYPELLKLQKDIQIASNDKVVYSNIKTLLSYFQALQDPLLEFEEKMYLVSKIIILLTVYLGPDILLKYMQTQSD